MSERLASSLVPIFVNMGLAVLLPYNSILTTMFEFNKYGMPDEGRDSFVNFGTAITVNSLFSVLSLIVFSIVGVKIALKYQLCIGFILVTLCMKALIILTQFNMGNMSTFYVVLIIFAINGASTGMTQGAIFATAGALGDGKLGVAGMVGLGWSGIACLLLAVIIKVFLPYPKDASFEERREHFTHIFLIYGVVAVTVVASSLLMIAKLMRNPTAKVALSATSANKDAADKDSALEDGLLQGQAETAPANDALAASAAAASAPDASAKDASVVDAAPAAVSESLSADLPSRGLLFVFWAAKPMLLSLFFHMVITFIAFPTFSLIFLRPAGDILPVIDPHAWNGVILVGCMQVGDLLGRMMLHCGIKVGTTGTVLSVPLRALFFYPLFVIAAKRAAIFPFLSTDLGHFTLMALFGVSSGWGTSLPFLHGNGYLDRPSEQKQLGFLLSLMLLLGITIGSQLPFVMFMAM